MNSEPGEFLRSGPVGLVVYSLPDLPTADSHQLR